VLEQPEMVIDVPGAEPLFSTQSSKIDKASPSSPYGKVRNF